MTKILNTKLSNSLKNGRSYDYRSWAAKYYRTHKSYNNNRNIYPILLNKNIHPHDNKNLGIIYKIVNYIYQIITYPIITMRKYKCETIILIVLLAIITAYLNYQCTLLATANTDSPVINTLRELTLYGIPGQLLFYLATIYCNIYLVFIIIVRIIKLITIIIPYFLSKGEIVKFFCYIFFNLIVISFSLYIINKTNTNVLIYGNDMIAYLKILQICTGVNLAMYYYFYIDDCNTPSNTNDIRKFKFTIMNLIFLLFTSLMLVIAHQSIYNVIHEIIKNEFPDMTDLVKKMFGGGANNSASNSTSNEASENVSKYNKVKQINTNVQCGGEDNTNESYTENSVYQENTNKQTGNPNINIQKNENKQFIAEHNKRNSLFSQNTLVPSTSNTVMDNTHANPVEINPLANPLENSFNNIKYLSQDIQPYNDNSSNVSTNNLIEEINKKHEEMVYILSELDNEIKESLTNSNVITSKFKNYTNLISEATASHQETLNKIEILKNKLSNNPFYFM